MDSFEFNRRELLKHAVGSASIAALGTAGGSGVALGDEPPPEVGPVQLAPDFAGEFTVAPFAALEYPTQLVFGPSPDGGEPDLYATTSNGRVVRLPLTWTEVGPIYTEIVTVADGFSQPLGIAFHDGAMLVADSHLHSELRRRIGRITLLDGDKRTVIVDGLPNGLHNTNHLRIGTDGRLYIANGNSSDHGEGELDVYPYSGAFLAVDVSVVRNDPAVLQYIDEQGNEIDSHDIYHHSVNDDFNGKVDVIAWGFRNIFGLAFGGPNNDIYTGMNGGADPHNPDIFYRVDDTNFDESTGTGANHGFPWCMNDGRPGATDGIEWFNNPFFDEQTGEDEPYFEDSDTPDIDYRDCTNFHKTDGILGWNNCATGLGIPNGFRSLDHDLDETRFAFPEKYQTDAFIGECLVFGVQGWADKMATSRATTRNESHKITRVNIDSNGNPNGISDFLKYLQAPTDVVFGPQGAMYVADLSGIYRVQPIDAIGDVAPAKTASSNHLSAETLSNDTPRDLRTVRNVYRQFVPQVLTVSAGDTVFWQGDPTLESHTVASAATLEDAIDGNHNGDDPESFRIEIGGFSTLVPHTFDVPGSYPYFCELHIDEQQVGVIHVR